jgi:hypothetical protein
MLTANQQITYLLRLVKKSGANYLFAVYNYMAYGKQTNKALHRLILSRPIQFNPPYIENT